MSGGESDATLDALLNAADIRLVKELGSLLVGEPGHRSVSVADIQGSVIASSSRDHLGNAEAVARSVISSFPALGKTDAVVLSDPFSGSAHVQDHWVAVAVNENGALAALVLVQAHLADVGGQAFGNYYPQARDVWQEGVVTTPVRLARDGQVDRDVVETLKLNSRAPVLMAHDIALMHEIGARVAQRLSRTDLRSAGAAQVAVARERVRELSTTIAEEVRADGDVHNCAGPDAAVAVRLAPQGRTVIVDLSECSPQAEQGFINSTLATTRSAVARAFIDYSGAPSNSGVLSELDIRTTSGSVLDCGRSLAVGWSPFEPAFTIVDLLRGALSRWAEPQVPQRVREPTRPSVRIDGCREEGCRF